MLAFILTIIILVIIIVLCFRSEDAGINVIGAIIGLVTILSIPYVISDEFYNEHTVTCTVTEKDRGGDDGSYRIYTEECGVLANEDALFRGKFNSADTWTEIPDSGTITVRVVGARIPFLSDFPNILEIQDVKEAKS